jgi:hypothetical protein
MAVVRRRSTFPIPSVGIIAVALNLFDRDRGHFAACNWLPGYSKAKMREIEAQLYVGKPAISKGIRRIIPRFVVPAPYADVFLDGSGVCDLQLRGSDDADANDPRQTVSLRQMAGPILETASIAPVEAGTNCRYSSKVL